MKPIQFIIFGIIALFVYFSMHYYIYKGIIKAFELTYPKTQILSLVLFSLSLSFIIAQPLSSTGNTLYRIPVYIGYIWFGVLTLCLFAFLIKDLLLLLFYLTKFINNKLFIILNKNANSIFTVLALFMTLILTVKGIYNIKKDPDINRITIKIKDSKKFKDFFFKRNKSLKIVHIADIHLGILTDKTKLMRSIEMINKEKPDLVLITGDIIERDFCCEDDFIDILKNIKSKFGIFSVSGNHDYFSRIEKYRSLMKKSDIIDIDNRLVDIDTGITLYGTPDPMSNRFHEKKLVFRVLFKDIDKERFNILLSHQPLHFKEAVENGIDLQLSGHTHKGQIPPMTFLISLVFKYSYGLYKYMNSYIYTTSGIGFWGPPMRIFSHSEIVVLNIIAI